MSIVDNEQLSIRQIARAIKKYKIENNSIILVKANTILAKTIAEPDVMENLIKALDRFGISNVLFVIVDNFDDLKLLNEKQMNEKGWYFIEALKNIIHRRNKNGGEKQE